MCDVFGVVGAFWGDVSSGSRENPEGLGAARFTGVLAAGLSEKVGTFTAELEDEVTEILRVLVGVLKVSSVAGLKAAEAEPLRTIENSVAWPARLVVVEGFRGRLAAGLVASCPSGRVRGEAGGAPSLGVLATVLYLFCGAAVKSFCFT